VRDAAAPGLADETRLLRRALPARIDIRVATRKTEAVAALRRERAADIVLVDDALQTAGLAADRHLVLLDWARPFGNGWLLPAGRLREPPAALARADAILFTRARGPAPRHPAWAHVAATHVALAHEEITGLHRLDGGVEDGATLRGQGVAAICGLARPLAFEASLRDLGVVHGFDLRRCVRVGDHAPLEGELAKLVGRLHGLRCTRVLTSAKDAARLAVPEKWNEPLLVVEQRLVIADLNRVLEVLVPFDQGNASKSANTTESDTLT